MNGIRIALVLTVLWAAALGRSAAEEPRVLFLTTSEQFSHGPIFREDGQPGVADVALAALAKQMDLPYTSSKDADLINAAELAKYKLVIFYTQGDLTKPNSTETSVMEDTGVADLIAWIKAGGGFIGFHSATDTFDTPAPEPTPYIQMLGAEFRTHGSQFEGTLKVVDAGHPTMAHVPDGWKLHEEWYLFQEFNKKAMHVLALLDPGEAGRKQEIYQIPPYPVIWCSAVGKGRVYYNAIGHREDIWTNKTFLKSAADAMRWALGEGPTSAEANFDAVVPPDAPEVE